MNRCDESIIGTAYDAMHSKISAVSKGYYEDPFLSHIEKGSQQQQPIIRRGTHARVCVMDYAIDNFLSLYSSSDIGKMGAQIVVIGSGWNMDFWRAQSGLLMAKDSNIIIKDQNMSKDRLALGEIRWYEIDHPSLITKKLEILQSNPLIDFDHEIVISDLECDERETDGVSYAIRPKSIKGINRPGTSLNDRISSEDTLSDSCYHLIGYDLRNPFKDLVRILTDKHSFQREVPTLFLLECVQMYLPDQQSRSLLQGISDSCHFSYLALYDPILAHDRFGKTMEQNLRKKSLITDSTLSILQTRTLENQVDKLYQCGFDFVTGSDMMDAYNTIMSNAHKVRANRCEMLDEIEEWNLIMRHYCFAVACSINYDNDASKLKDDQGKSSVTSKMHLASLFCSCGSNGIFEFDEKNSITRTRSKSLQV